MKIIISQAQSNEAATLSVFIRSVYDVSVAPHYLQRGNNEFYTYIDSSAIKNRLETNHWILMAENGSQLLGIIEVRDDKHVSMLFVKLDHQRKGIGKQLLEAAIKKANKSNPNLKKMTVHSSPNSLAAYERLGFKPVSQEKMVNGIRFTTMEKTIGVE